MLAERKARPWPPTLARRPRWWSAATRCSTSTAWSVGKPAVAAEVARPLGARWPGAAGVLRTGHCVIDTATGRAGQRCRGHHRPLRQPVRRRADAYVATGEPLQVAGAFTIDGYAAPFVDGIDGDPGNVIGLSLPLLRALLAELGEPITELWR